MPVGSVTVRAAWNKVFSVETLEALRKSSQGLETGGGHTVGGRHWETVRGARHCMSIVSYLHSRHM